MKSRVLSPGAISCGKDTVSMPPSLLSVYAADAVRPDGAYGHAVCIRVVRMQAQNYAVHCVRAAVNVCKPHKPPYAQRPALLHRLNREFVKVAFRNFAVFRRGRHGKSRCEYKRGGQCKKP